ncbi:hypothetical protein HQ590_05910, partial [bacterium]|nr:hypothetical protein [bacterium]
SCMFEGADLYQRRTGRKDIKRWLEDFLEEARQGVEDNHADGVGLSVMAANVMAIGYERTKDKRFLRAGMTCVEELMDTEWWPTPPHEVKPMAITYRGLIRFLHHAEQAGMLELLEFGSRRQRQPGRRQRRPVT